MNKTVILIEDILEKKLNTYESIFYIRMRIILTDS